MTDRSNVGEGSDVSWQMGNESMSGTLVKPEGAGPFPAARHSGGQRPDRPQLDLATSVWDERQRSAHRRGIGARRVRLLALRQAGVRATSDRILAGAGRHAQHAEPHGRARWSRAHVGESGVRARGSNLRARQQRGNAPRPELPAEPARDPLRRNHPGGSSRPLGRRRRPRTTGSAGRAHPQWGSPAGLV